MFMALMCDGITDVMQDDEARNWCQVLPVESVRLAGCQICAELEMRRPGPPDPVKRRGPRSPLGCSFEISLCLSGCRIACGALVQEAYKRGSEER